MPFRGRGVLVAPKMLRRSMAYPYRSGLQVTAGSRLVIPPGLGPELVDDGSFLQGDSQWFIGGPEWFVENERMVRRVATEHQGFNQPHWQRITTDLEYLLRFDVMEYTTGSLAAYIRGYYAWNNAFLGPFPQRISVIAPAGTSTATSISFGSSNFIGELDNISLRQIRAVHGPELVENGTFDEDLSGWTDTSSGSGYAVWNNGAADIYSLDTSVDNRGQLSVGWPCKTGDVFDLKFEVIAGPINTKGGNWAGSSGWDAPMQHSDGSVRRVLTAGGDGTYWLTIYNTQGNSTKTFDNVSVKRILNMS